jgi:hypothetical protein
LTHFFSIFLEKISGTELPERIACVRDGSGAIFAIAKKRERTARPEGARPFRP